MEAIARSLRFRSKALGQGRACLDHPKAGHEASRGIRADAKSNPEPESHATFSRTIISGQTRHLPTIDYADNEFPHVSRDYYDFYIG